MKVLAVLTLAFIAGYCGLHALLVRDLQAGVVSGGLLTVGALWIARRLAANTQ